MCPECLILLKNVPAIGSHCRDKGDETHRGLGLTKRKEFPEFLQCYQRAVGWNVTLTLKDGPGRNTFAPFFFHQRGPPMENDIIGATFWSTQSGRNNSPLRVAPYGLLQRR